MEFLSIVYLNFHLPHRPELLRHVVTLDADVGCSNSKVSQASPTVDVIGELPVFPNKYESTSPFEQK